MKKCNSCVNFHNNVNKILDSKEMISLLLQYKDACKKHNKKMLTRACSQSAITPFSLPCPIDFYFKFQIEFKI